MQNSDRNLDRDLRKHVGFIVGLQIPKTINPINIHDHNANNKQTDEHF
jgi:hypothetical protein